MLSNGDARAAANHINNQNNTSNQQNSATFSTDSDLTKLSTDMGYNQKLYDVNILSFDIRPAVSGKITFSYVFGSEEYEEYSPKTSKCTRHSTHYFVQLVGAEHVAHGCFPDIKQASKQQQHQLLESCKSAVCFAAM